MSTIYILWLRQLKRYWRSKPRIIGSIGQPLLFLIALGFGFGPIFQKAGGGNYIDFLAPGVISQAILFMAIFSGIELIWDRQFGFLKATLVAPVPRLEIVLGKVLGGATIAALQGIIVLLLSLLIGFRPQNVYTLPLAFALMFLMALLYTALGTAIASLMEDFHGFQLIMNFLVMPTFFLSGALFPIKNTPPFIQLISKINPLSFGVDGLREVLVGIKHFGLVTDIVTLGAVVLILLFICSYLFSKIEA
ncbi:ABC transporter permease [Candidatus Microgenomates bacterium]|nr:ABC transporter permease [Candidatus Microgenomates bacterium]